MDSIYSMLGRTRELFADDLAVHEADLASSIQKGSFLVVGGAGSIGRAVVQQIFKRSPRQLHVVDISENNLVELVRDLRSSLGYIKGEFRTFAIDFTSLEFEALLEQHGAYDYVFNLSALKHVRSERDPFTVMRMIDVNILATERLRRWSSRNAVRNFFCVSTDKATNPVNMMGCSKRIMELLLFAGQAKLPASTARFANVAFSDGSLLHGFNQRIAKKQPISAPMDVRRYFITQEEAGLLCVFSGLLGRNRETYFPKLDSSNHLISFAEIAERYLHALGYVPVQCATEDEARERMQSLIEGRRWPVYYFSSDTSGEKPVEEFYTDNSDVSLAEFVDIGIVRHSPTNDAARLDEFLDEMNRLRRTKRWTKKQLLDLFQAIVPEFTHHETGKYLDDRM